VTLRACVVWSTRKTRSDTRGFRCDFPNFAFREKKVSASLRQEAYLCRETAARHFPVAGAASAQQEHQQKALREFTDL
jgi:hypothetical protein